MSSLIRDDFGHAVQVPARIGAAHSVSIDNSASAATSTAVGTTTTFVTIWCDEAFYWSVGASPTASATTGAWPANVPLSLPVTPGESLVAGLAMTAASATLHVQEWG